MVGQAKIDAPTRTESAAPPVDDRYKAALGDQRPRLSQPSTGSKKQPVIGDVMLKIQLVDERFALGTHEPVAIG